MGYIQNVLGNQKERVQTKPQNSGNSFMSDKLNQIKNQKKVEPVQYTENKLSFGDSLKNFISSIPKSIGSTLGLDEKDYKSMSKGGFNQAKIAGKIFDNIIRKGTQAVLSFPTEMLTEVLRNPTKSAKEIPITNPLLQTIYGTDKITSPSVTAKQNVKQYGPGVGSGLFFTGEAMKAAGLAGILASLSPKTPKTKVSIPEIDNLYQQAYDTGLQVIKPETKVSTTPAQNVHVGDTIFSKEVGARFVVDEVKFEPVFENGKIGVKQIVRLKDLDGKIIEVTPEELINFKRINKELSLPEIKDIPPEKVGSTPLTKEFFKNPRKQPFAPTTRANQFNGWVSDLVKKIEKDPIYLKNLNEAGGGRVITHQETFLKAIKDMGDVSSEINKIANWKEGSPVSTVDNAKVKIVQTYLAEEMKKNVLERNQSSFDTNMADFRRVQSGAQIMGAESGRATEIQSVQVINDVNDILGQMEKISKSTSGDFLTATRELGALGNKLRNLRNRMENTTMVKFIRTAESYASAAKLTSLMTHVVNTVSNFATFVQKGLEDVTTSLQQLVKGRPYDALQTAKYSFGTPKGFVNAAKNFWDALSGEIAKNSKGETPTTKTFFADINSKLPKGLQKTARFGNPYRWLGAADTFWKSIIEDAEIKTRAKIESRGNPELYDNYIKNTPKEWVEAAKAKAKDFTFQGDPDVLLKGIMAIRNIPGGRFLVPFVQTPYNIYKFYFERSPLGVFSARNWKGFLGSNKELASTNAAMREAAISRLAVGSVISYIAYEFVANNMVTGAYPTDPSERALWQAEGKQPWSMNINGKWVKYNRFQPIGLYLTAAAVIHDAIANNDLKQVDSTATKLVAGLSNAALDMPFLSGMSAVFDLLNDPIRNAKQFENLVITGFIPNFTRDIRQQVDPNKRQVENVGEAIQNMIPGQSEKLPEKVDLLGRTQQYTPNQLERFTKVITQETTTEATKILRDIKYSPTLPNLTLSVTKGTKTKEVELKGKEAEQFLKDMGQATNEAILYAASLPEYQNTNDIDVKKLYVTRAIEDRRTKTRNKWKIKYQNQLLNN